MDHETSEKEPDQHGAFHRDLILVMARRHQEREEEEEPTDEKHRIMSGVNRPPEKAQMHTRDPCRDRCFTLLPRLWDEAGRPPFHPPCQQFEKALS